jgi:NTP pyrophosphatase (non-canonical NTP hydrolase)
MAVPELSDASTTVSRLKAQIKEFVHERDWDQFHFPKDLAIGLTIEASEVLEHFRFRSNEEIQQRLTDPAFRRDLGHELADVLYFTLLMCANLDMDASQMLEEKLALSRQRYPIDQAKGRNLKYTELERVAGEENTP